MWIVTHLSKSYDWIPVPTDVEVSKADIAAKIVKPASNGGYLMRLPKEGKTYNLTCLAEHHVIAKIIHERTEIGRGNRIFTRKQAIAHFMSEHIMPSEAHHSWITGFEVDADAGPDEALLRSMLTPHTLAIGRSGQPNIDPGDIEGHVAAYMESDVSEKDHVAHLHSHFRVPVQS